MTRVPTETILVKGAWASSSDSVTPLPEDSKVTTGVFTDKYFGITLALPKDWKEKYKGPPPSENGRYVLAQISSNPSDKASRGSLLITADDLFFTLLPTTNALEFANYSKENLPSDYRLESAPTPTRLATDPFIFYAYWSPVAQLHWYVLSAQVRCHVVQFVLSSRDTKLLENMVLDLTHTQLALGTDHGSGNGGGGEVPVCVKDYANGRNLMARVDPVFTEHKANSVPVRVIIDKQGKVKHIHFLSAFPDQVKAITESLMQWRFKPYLLGGQPVEVETGIMFGRSAVVPREQAVRSATE
jgi:hypothetical protein